MNELSRRLLATKTRDLSSLGRALADAVVSALRTPGLTSDEECQLKKAGTEIEDSVKQLKERFVKLPSDSERYLATRELVRALFAAFSIGNRGVRNPIVDRLGDLSKAESVAKARLAKPAASRRDAIIERHAKALWARNSKLVGNANGTARSILKKVNEDLKDLKEPSITIRIIRDRLVKLPIWSSVQPPK